MTLARPSGRVERVYQVLREMAVDFRLKPGERINEVALSKALGASRTPLREALNRLVSENFLTFEPGRGFFGRKLLVKDVADVYQVRCALEQYAVSAAAGSASDAELAELSGFLDRTAMDTGHTSEQLLAFDEYFHESIAGLTGNGELLRTLRNLNARIRFFRWVDMQSRRPRTQNEHRAILEAMQRRDGARAGELMNTHISRRSDEIAAAVRECHSRIFMEDDNSAPAFLQPEAGW